MKPTIAIVIAALIAALIVLAHLVNQASPQGTPGKALANASEPRIVITPRAMIEHRIEIMAGQLIAPGLPPWTVSLATMPASRPPPANTKPPIGPPRGQ